MSSPLIRVNNPQLQYQSVLAVPDDNIGAVKQLTNFFPIQAGSFSNQSLTRMEFNVVSDNAAAILAEHYLTFDMAVLNGSTTVGVTAIVTGKADSWLSQIQVQTFSGVPIYDSLPHGANLKSRIDQNMIISNENKTMNWQSGLQNLGTADASCTQLTSTPQKFAIKLPAQFFRDIEAFPLPIIGGLRIILFLELDNVALAVEAPASGNYYQITNPVLKVPLVPYEQDYLQLLLKEAVEGHVLLDFGADFFYEYAAATNATNTVQVQKGFRWANHVIEVQRLAGDYNTANKDYLGKAQYFGGLGDGNTSGGFLQIQAGSKNFPYNPITDDVTAWVELQKIYNIWNDNDQGNQVTKARYQGADVTGANQGSTGPLCIRGVDLTTCGEPFTGVDLNGSYMSIRLTTISSPASNYLDIFINFSNLLVLRSKQAVELLN